MTIAETRAKSMEENVKKLEIQLQSYMEKTELKSEATYAKIDELARKLDVLVEKLIPNQAGILGSAPSGSHFRETSEGKHKSEHRGEPLTPDLRERSYHHNSNSRVKFPYFDGAGAADPCSWLRRCERYFHYNHITDQVQKLEEAVLHLQGRAEAWYFSFQISRGKVR